MPETCRVSRQNKCWIFDASSWLFYTKLITMHGHLNIEYKKWGKLELTLWITTTPYTLNYSRYKSKQSLTSTLDVKCWSTWLRGKRGALCGHSIRMRVGSRVGANGTWAMRKNTATPVSATPVLQSLPTDFIRGFAFLTQKWKKKSRDQICIAHSIVRKISASTSAPLHPFFSNSSEFLHFVDRASCIDSW
jgi:hypothetical protein